MMIRRVKYWCLVGFFRLQYVMQVTTKKGTESAAGKIGYKVTN